MSTFYKKIFLLQHYFQQIANRKSKNNKHLFSRCIWIHSDALFELCVAANFLGIADLLDAIKTAISNKMKRRVREERLRNRDPMGFNPRGIVPWWA